METYSLMVLFHIFLLVFWLGTDLGVLFAAKMSERSDLSAETRMTLIQLAMVLDRLPRTALILILPSGLTMASSLQMIELSSLVLTVVWMLAPDMGHYYVAGFSKPGIQIREKLSPD